MLTDIKFTILILKTHSVYSYRILILNTHVEYLLKYRYNTLLNGVCAPHTEYSAGILMMKSRMEDFMQMCVKLKS